MKKIKLTCWKGVDSVSFKLNRINHNQTQVFFDDGRYETLTNDELDDFLLQNKVEENAVMNDESFE